MLFCIFTAQNKTYQIRHLHCRVEWRHSATWTDATPTSFWRRRHHSTMSQQTLTLTTRGQKRGRDRGIQNQSRSKIVETTRIFFCRTILYPKLVITFIVRCKIKLFFLPSTSCDLSKVGSVTRFRI